MREMRKRERERRSNDGKIQTRRESMREFHKHGQNMAERIREKRECMSECDCVRQRERDEDRKNKCRLVCRTY